MIFSTRYNRKSKKIFIPSRLVYDVGNPEHLETPSQKNSVLNELANRYNSHAYFEVDPPESVTTRLPFKPGQQLNIDAHMAVHKRSLAVMPSGKVQPLSTPIVENKATLVSDKLLFFGNKDDKALPQLVLLKSITGVKYYLTLDDFLSLNPRASSTDSKDTNTTEEISPAKITLEQFKSKYGTPDQWIKKQADQFIPQINAIASNPNLDREEKSRLSLEKFMDFRSACFNQLLELNNQSDQPDPYTQALNAESKNIKEKYLK